MIRYFISLLLALTLSLFANEFRLASMGRAYFVFPDPETDMWINAAYLTFQEQSVLNLSSSYQRYGLQPTATIQPAMAIHTVLPDETGGFTQWYRTQLKSIMVRSWGTLAFRLVADRITAPEKERYTGDVIAANTIYPPPVWYTGQTLNTMQWLPEIAYARTIGHQMHVGFRIIPYGQVFKPEFYQLIPFDYSDRDVIHPARYGLVQIGIVNQLSPRVRFGFSTMWEQYRWSTENLPNNSWSFSSFTLNLITDVRVKTNGNFRLWFRLNHPQLKAPVYFYSWEVLTPQYFRYRSISPLTAVKTLALSYSLQLPAFDVNVALVNDWGTLLQRETIIDNTYIEGEIYHTSTRLDVINSYLTLGIRLKVHRTLAVQSGFVLGTKGYENSGIFESSNTHSLTRMPTVGFSWQPTSHWEINANILPAAGRDIVNSSLDGQNFYQFSIRYYPKRNK